MQQLNAAQAAIPRGAGASARSVNGLNQSVNGLVGASQRAANALRGGLVSAANVAGAALSRVGRGVGGVGRALGGMGRGALGITKLLGTFGAALGAAFGITAIRGAIRFQEQLATINTIAKLSVESTAALGRNLRGIAVDRGVRLDDLAESYYEFLSAGIGVGKTFDALASDEARLAINTKVLKSATDLAIGGLSTQTEATQLMAFALNTFGLNMVTFQRRIANEAGITATTIDGASTEIADYFAKAVEIGVVKADQIAKTFSTIALTAKNAGIGIDQISAAYAYLTQRGFTAARVTVSMNRAILEMIKPGKVLQEVMKKTGDNFALIARQQGLNVALQRMRDDAAKLGINFVDLFKRQEAYRFALGITSDATDKTDMAFRNYNETLQKVRNSTKEILRDPITGKIVAIGTAAIQAYIRSDTLSRNLVKLQEAFRSIGITIGFWFLAPLNSAVKAITSVIHSTDLWLQNLNPAQTALARQAATLAGVVTGILALSGGLQAFLIVGARFAPMLGLTATNLYGVQRALGAVFLPLGLLIAAIGTFSLLVNNGVGQFGRYQGALADVASLARGVIGVFREVGDSIAYTWGVLRAGGNVGVTVDNAIDHIGETVQGLGPSFQRVAASIGGAFLSVGTLVVRGLQRAIPAIIGWAASVIRTVAPTFVNLGREVVGAIARATPGIIAGLGRFVGEVADNLQKAAPAIFRALGEWTRTFINWVRSVIPVVLDALGGLLRQVGDWIVKAAPTIGRTLGEWAVAIAGALGDIIAAIVPVLADAAGKLIDWIAASIPAVLGAIARWIDSVVKSLVPLGQDGGPVAGAMGGAGGQLIKWITDRIPGALQALGIWAIQVVGWVATVLLPRLVIAFFGLGAAVVKALWDGITGAISGGDGAAAANTIAGAVTLVLGAAVVLNAGRIAGTAVSAAFRLAAIAGMAAARAAVSIGETVLLMFMTSGIPAATAAGTAVAAAFLLAAALTVIIPVVIAFKIGSDIGKQATELQTQVETFARTASLEGLKNARAGIQTGIDEAGLFDIYDVKPKLAIDLFIVDAEIATREAAAKIRTDLDNALTSFGLDPAAMHTFTQKVWDDIETAMARVGWASLKKDFQSFLKGTFGVDTSGLGGTIGKTFDFIKEQMKSGAIVLKDGVLSVVEKTQADTDWSSLFRQGPDAAKNSAQDYQDAYNLLVTTIVNGRDDVDAALKGVIDAPLVSDADRIKDLQGTVKDIDHRIKAAMLAHDTTTVLRLKDARKNITDQITALQKGTEILKAQEAEAKRAASAAGTVVAASNKLTLNPITQQKLTKLGEAGPFSRQTEIPFKPPKPMTPAQVDAQTQPFRDIVTTVSTETGKLPTFVGKAADDAATAFINNSTAKQTSAVTSVTNVVSRISAFLASAGLRSTFYTFGANLIQSLIDGINGKSNDAAEAGRHTAAATSTHLAARSPPRTGPLHDLPLWGARYVTTLADSINANLRPAEMAGYAMAGAVAGGINSGPKGIVPLGASGGRFGGGVGGYGGIGDRELAARHTELLGQIAANSALGAHATSKLASTDPIAGGPLAARGTLSALKHLSHGRGN